MVQMQNTPKEFRRPIPVTRYQMAVQVLNLIELLIDYHWFTGLLCNDDALTKENSLSKCTNQLHDVTLDWEKKRINTDYNQSFSCI